MSAEQSYAYAKRYECELDCDRGTVTVYKEPGPWAETPRLIDCPECSLCEWCEERVMSGEFPMWVSDEPYCSLACVAQSHALGELTDEDFRHAERLVEWEQDQQRWSGPKRRAWALFAINRIEEETRRARALRARVEVSR